MYGNPEEGVEWSRKTVEWNHNVPNSGIGDIIEEACKFCCLNPGR